MTTAIVLQDQPVIVARNRIHSAFDLMVYGLTDTSRRQYEHTFNSWRDWCLQNGVTPANLSAENVIHYLESARLARRTKQARLTHLRRLAQTLHTGDVTNTALKQNYEQLQLLKLKKDDRGGSTRAPRRLKPDEVFEAIRHWSPETNLGRRNRAMLAFLFSPAGPRRSELVALKWADIDFDDNLLTIWHGKGDKKRVVDLGSAKTVEIIKEWRSCIPDYTYVFVAVQKGDKILVDQPISTETVRRVCKASGDFRPHDCRRTSITDQLNNRTPIHIAQANAGHANGATTLTYADVADAQQRRAMTKQSW